VLPYESLFSCASIDKNIKKRKYKRKIIIRKIKEKKKKRNINIDLAVLPSHNTGVVHKRDSSDIHEV